MPSDTASTRRERLKDCLSRFRPGRRVEIPDDEPFPKLEYDDVNEETTRWAIDKTSASLETEADRNELLDTKGLQLVGFSGVILAVLVNAGSEALGRDLGCVGTPVFIASYLVSLAGLLSAAWLTLLGVLVPRTFKRLGPDETAAYLTEPDLLRAKPKALHLRTLKGMARSGQQQHAVAEDKARSLQCAYGAFLIGLLATATVAVILGLAAL